MNATSGAPALAFHETTFDTVNRDGQLWLRAADIARALGYAETDAISRIYRRNADEFTRHMALTVNLTVKGFAGEAATKPVMIFSLRGAHLLGMFARTERAKEFRRWVLDVLDRHTQSPAGAKSLPPAPVVQRIVMGLEMPAGKIVFTMPLNQSHHVVDAASDASLFSFIYEVLPLGKVPKVLSIISERAAANYGALDQLLKERRDRAA